MISLSRGDSERAAALFEEGLLLQRDLKYKTAMLFGLLGIAGVAALRKQPSRAAKLFGASEALREEIGLVVTPLSGGHFGLDGYLAAARAGLGEAAFDATFSEGQAMSAEQAVEYALSAEEPAPPVPSKKPPRTHSDEPAHGLTRRQREVAVLVGRGLTNAQIAGALAISKHTVANHVATILKKLSLPSRSRIAVWVTERSLRDPG
jgi:non-specific serine/threonine protein kinase